MYILICIKLGKNFGSSINYVGKIFGSPPPSPIIGKYKFQPTNLSCLLT